MRAGQDGLRLRLQELRHHAGVGLLVDLDPVVPGVEAAGGADERGVLIDTVALQQLVNLGAQRRPLGDLVGRGGAVVGVVLAVENQARPDGSFAFL